MADIDPIFGDGDILEGGDIDNILDDAIDDEPIQDEYIPDDSLGIKSLKDNKIYYNGDENIKHLFLDKFNYIPNRDYFVNTEQIDLNPLNLINPPIYFMPVDIIDKLSFGKYVMVLYGFTLDGTKTELTITGVIPYFDVMIPKGMSNEQFTVLLTNLIISESSDSYTDDVQAYPIRGFNEEPVTFKRVFNTNLQNRKKTLTVVLNAGFETASDDRNNYHRKVAREYGLLLSDWMEINNVSNKQQNNGKYPNNGKQNNGKKNNGNSEINNGAPILTQIVADINDIKTISQETKQSSKLFIKDRTLVMTWDIETYSKRNMGELPLAIHKEDNAFMICATIHWKDQVAPLYQVCITDYETEPDDRWITIICGGNSNNSGIICGSANNSGSTSAILKDENNSFKNIIKAFALCFEMFRPDILCGFNDSDYDWPFVIEKAKQFEILDWMWNRMSITHQPQSLSAIQSFYNMYKQQVKITGADTTVYCSYLKITGCIMIDVRVCLRKLYPKAEKTSLKYFLDICNLGGKADMPMKKMWTFYKNAMNEMNEMNETHAMNAMNAMNSSTNSSPASEGMRHIAHYCVIDAYRCQELMVKRGVINDLRELTSLAYMTLYDAHYYANGKRVCNLLGAYANRKNILISMIPKPQFESGKYPGAFVFPPDKGLTPNPGNLLNIEFISKKIRDAKYTIKRNKERSKDECQRICNNFDELPIYSEINNFGERPLRSESNVYASDSNVYATESSEYNEQELLEEIKQLELDLIKAFLAFNKDRPVTGLDFSSLYPSLIMAYNLSPEKIILNKEVADKFRELGYTVYNIEFPYNDRIVKAYSIMHNNIEANIGLYPTVLIDLFNKRADVKKILAKYKSIKEIMDVVFGNAKKHSDNTNVLIKPDYKLFIKDAIYEMRSETMSEISDIQSVTDDKIIISPGSTLEEEKEDNKRKMKNLKEKLSILETVLDFDSTGEEDNTITIYGMNTDANVNIANTITNPANRDKEFIQKVEQYYEDALFKCNSANVKQNAIKVYMNSFYGEAGNPLSPFFLLELAGGVTSSGQHNIKLVAKFVTEEKGFFIKYGDTDSLYLVPPAKYFTECDRDFVDGKLNREEYWSAMVRITMRVMNSLKNEVNDHLYKDNGSKYLKMAYEEVLYPVVFTGKKKYYGIAHENEVNFRPNHLFIRGIDIIKQGQSGLAKTIGNKIMWESMSISNTKTVHEIVKHVVSDAVNNKGQWKFEDFIKSASWRPNKNNISVHVFMKRMQVYFDIENKQNQKRLAMGGSANDILYELPEAGERFNYVLVQKNSPSDMYDIHGRKKTIKVGDRMEFANVAKLKQFPIDITFYIKSYVVGICARFINYDDNFYPSKDLIASKQMDDKKIDKYTQDSAKKYLDHFIKTLENNDPALEQIGTLYKKAFSITIKKSKQELSPIVSNIFHGKFINYENIIYDINSLYDNTNTNINEYIEKHYLHKIEYYCNQFISCEALKNENGSINGKKLYKWGAIVDNIMRTDNKTILQHFNVIEGFQTNVHKINLMAIKYDSIIENMVKKERLLLTGNTEEVHTDDTEEAHTNGIEEVNCDEPISFMDAIDDIDKEILLSFKSNLSKMFGINMNLICVKFLKQYIEKLKKTITNDDIKPSIRDIKLSIKTSAMEFYPTLTSKSESLKVCGNISF